jgi:hypothetical protein
MKHQIKIGTGAVVKFKFFYNFKNMLGTKGTGTGCVLHHNTTDLSIWRQNTLYYIPYACIFWLLGK